MARLCLVLGHVDVRLPVLDADAHGEGLGLHGHSGGMEHFKRVPGAVAKGKNSLSSF